MSIEWGNADGTGGYEGYTASTFGVGIATLGDGIATRGEGAATGAEGPATCEEGMDACPDATDAVSSPGIVWGRTSYSVDVAEAYPDDGPALFLACSFRCPFGAFPGPRRLGYGAYWQGRSRFEQLLHVGVCPLHFSFLPAGQRSVSYLFYRLNFF